jgi:hypothetical protein
MRSKVFFILFFVFASNLFFSQNDDANSNNKVRFGLRLNPQPSWYASNDKNTTPSGAIFGYGFGLNVEYRFSEVASLLTGLGGDFEGGKIKYRLDPVNNFQVCYFKNDEDAFIQPKNNSAINELKKSGNTVYLLKDRKINSTFVTLPVILKLSTKDINGLKYFGLIGVEIGFRIKAQASDNFYEVRKYLSDTTFEVMSNATMKDIDIGKDGSLVPLRLGLNVGAGVEYRLAGSTSFFASVNYFNSLTNFMRSDSKYLMTNWQTIELAKGSTQMTYKMLGQNLILKAVRINIGFMF